MKFFQEEQRSQTPLGEKKIVLLGPYFVSEERFEMETFCLCFLPLPKIEHLGIFFFSIAEKKSKNTAWRMRWKRNF